MNSIATQKRTDLTSGTPVITLLRSVLPVVVLCVLWISFQPFEGANTSGSGGSLINQLGYSGLCAITIAMLFTAIDRRVTIAMLSLPWLILFAGLGASVFLSPAPSDALRAVAFSIIVTVLAAGFFTLPQNAEALGKVLRIGCLATLGLCYFGVIFLPADAIHQAGEVESQHSGFWRGIFTHKNIAGPMMASIVFAGIYLFRRGMTHSGALITILGLFFIAQTGSKTSLAVAPLVAFMVLFPALMGMRGLSALAVFVTAVATHALTIGTVYSPFLDAILRTFDDTTSFTGRIEIWEFSKPFLLGHWLTGFGYDGFWATAVTANAEQPFDRIWDPRGIVHGHNGFLDIGLLMGIPMIFVMIWAVLISPILNYLKVPNRRENILLADFLLMIVAFTVMNSALESFYFRRDDPVWLTLVLAVFGLRFISRFPISRT